MRSLLSIRTKNALIFIGLLIGFVLLEAFYFSFAIPFSMTFSIFFFWEYFLIWFAASFILSEFLTRSDNGARVMMLIAAMIFIIAGTVAEAFPTRLEAIVGPMFPGWYGGLLLFLCVYVARDYSLLLPVEGDTHSNRCSSCDAQVSENEKVCSRCGHRFTGSTTQQTCPKGELERGLFVVTGALSRKGGFYDLYFTENRIVAIKVGSFFSGRKPQKEQGKQMNLDQLLQKDPKSNYQIPMTEIKSLKMSSHAFLTSFSGKTLEIRFGNSKKTFSISRRVFRKLEEKFSITPSLSKKVQSFEFSHVGWSAFW